MDIRQQIAHEIYRQQMIQRLPDPYPTMLPVQPPMHQHLSHHMQQQHQFHSAAAAHGLMHVPAFMPPGLPGAEVRLQNADMWQEFHETGTEMIITKSGRRMFPSLRTALSGLDDDTNYCVMIEMVPIGECRFKYSGTQWVPAGGPEPQSNCRMYLHPDSPALGSHWMAQPVLFNKIKLTNNTLDHSGHIVLASMHKYAPRIHVIRASDLAHLPYSPQQSFCFRETEFIAVTAYQNDRITRLKIDNNPFAKGFRESGQSRCKRKNVSASPSATSAGRSDGDDDDDDTEAGTARSVDGATAEKRGRQLEYVSGHCDGTDSPNTCIQQDEEEIDVGADELPRDTSDRLAAAQPTKMATAYASPPHYAYGQLYNQQQHQQHYQLMVETSPTSAAAAAAHNAWLEIAMSAFIYGGGSGGSTSGNSASTQHQQNYMFDAMLWQQQQHQQHQQQQQQHQQQSMQHIASSINGSSSTYSPVMSHHSIDASSSSSRLSSPDSTTEPRSCSASPRMAVTYAPTNSPGSAKPKKCIFSISSILGEGEADGQTSDC